MRTMLDILVLVVLNCIAVFVSVVWHTEFLTSTFLFLGIPSLYLILRERRIRLNVVGAALIVGLLFCFVFDFIAEFNKAWGWNGGLLWGRIFGVVQIDVMVWFVLWLLQIFLFYEHFIDRTRLVLYKSEQQLKMFIAGVLSVFLLLVIYTPSPSLLYISKAYFVLCLFVLIPFFIICVKKPKIVRRTLLIIPYFFFVYITHEITALQLHQWNFPGDYLGWIQVMGVRFPVEEFVFWIILSSLVGATYYEFYFDNQKN
ncbi:MAG: hypothetical protein KGN01_00885 [Patescibacteria group bacterium]|nr:hypothetical protein [Patescibacteria group bacterium]